MVCSPISPSPATQRQVYSPFTPLSNPSTALPNTNVQPSPARRFLRTLYGDGRGYVEVSSIEGDPRPKCGGIYRKDGYYRYPEQLPLIEQRCAALAELHGNVYASSTLYADRSRKHPLPSRVIFLDDAPPEGPLPYSMYVRTSAGHGHAYLLADHLLDNPVRRDFQRRAATTCGSDTSGADLQQIVRVPNSFNTKAHGHYPVTLEQFDPTRSYSVETLAATFPPLPETAARRAKTDDDSTPQLDLLDMEAVRRHIANMPALLTSGRMRCIKPSTQTGRILTGEMLSFTVNGSPDASRSMNRCTVAHGLWVRGFPNEEIAAILYTQCDWGSAAEKGSAWLWNDIQRCLLSAHATYPNTTISPTRYQMLQPAGELPTLPPKRKSRVRNDRPKCLDATALLAWYWSQTDCGTCVT